ncbi:uncharacterized protein BCR38DRAFT_487351 [Pseudomassariella vexata]|uniref:BHLH domain-containing protein n=1 Tax=Pseudomassariella vexata TaxID=1141098 RepID=A0A1Y2DQM6_9PEZI|nr:uncharacterized protein BCR38DRAFT_487351 [Pseudomassariella vexata]ORY61603.1 hypothetical protein BCR38DRAFT_487351 [Pseudomassariella vexata]
MDGDVLQSIELFPAANSKAFDSIIDSSSNCLPQLSSISFWDNFDNRVEASVASAPTVRATQAHKAASPTGSAQVKESCLGSPKPVKVTKVPSKRQRTPERKRARTSQDTSALDCSDYWLRFDSDDDSVERLGDFDRRDSTTSSRRPSGLIQPRPRLRRVGTSDSNSFKLAFPSPVEDFIDDSALDHALSDGDDFMAFDDSLMKRDPTQPRDVAPERLYSTPLSWEAPQPGVHMDSYLNLNPTFNDPERQRLLAIALGTGMAPTATNTPGSRPSTSTEFTFEMHHSPASSDSTSNDFEPRRKTPPKSSRPSQASFATETKEKPKTKNSERAAHNDIERKYRTNLKDRISDLREAVPSLRSIPEDSHDDGDSPVMASRAPKVSKGTVLTKATEYIRQLERRNRNMSQKNEELTRRLQAFEQLLAAASPSPSWQPQGYGAPVFNPRAYPS